MKTYPALLLSLLGLLLSQAARAATQPNAWQIADTSIASGVLFYTNTLTAAQKVAATNNGWHFTVVSRLVESSGSGIPAQNMIYGNGVRRFYAAWDANASGQLVAILGGSPSTTNVLASGAAATNYHRHELVYDPVTANGTYLFDGARIRTWLGEAQAAQNGLALWGANASAGKGTMNYHQVQFAISGLGTVSEYDAGFTGSPAIAPSPTSQGWSLTWTVPSTTLTNLPVSPDAVALPPGFTSSPIAGLPGVSFSSVAWGDYDNDGRLDFLLTGDNSSTRFSQLWRNTGSGFSNVTSQVAAGLPGVREGSVAWGDFDNDGRLDFLLTGLDSGFNRLSQLWRNTPTGFSNVTSRVAVGLPAVADSAVAWGDYDNDGRLDFLMTGFGPNGPISQVWRNTGSGGVSNVTSQVAPGLPGVFYSSVAWGDYDNDGRLDFLVTGQDASGVFRSQLWRNTGAGFTNVPIAGLQGVDLSSVAWGDFDNDGRLDFLLTGRDSGFNPLSQLWRNTPTGFSNVTPQVAAGLPGVRNSSVAWGDYDNDGRLDFLLTGLLGDSTTRISQLWRNTGRGFSNVTSQVAAGLSVVRDGSVAWSDYDNDGRLDFLLIGNSGPSIEVSQLWRNSFSASNSPPSAPTGLVTQTNGANSVTLSWNPAH